MEETKAEEKELAVFRVPSPHYQPYPWLVPCDGEERKRQFFYSITENRFYDRFIPELHESELVISCNNRKWLAYQDICTNECFLLNTSTMDKVPLPEIEDLSDYRICVLSSSPITKGRCRVILFDGIPYKFLSCNLGDTEFISREVIFEDSAKGLYDPFGEAIDFEGKLYVLTFTYDLVMTDYSDPHLSFKVLIQGLGLHNLLPTHTERKIYLVESFGELLFVYTRFRDCELTDLKIYKAEFTTREWVRVQSLGDRAISGFKVWLKEKLCLFCKGAW